LVTLVAAKQNYCFQEPFKTIDAVCCLNFLVIGQRVADYLAGGAA